MKTLTKNNNFYQIEHDDVLDSDEPFILIMHYSGNFLETETYEDEIFAGKCTDMYWGDGREDPMYTNIVVLERVHKLSEEKQWVEVNPYGRETIETKFDFGNIVMESEDTTNMDNNMMEKPNGMEDAQIPKWLMFTPKDPEMSLEDAMKLWLSSE